MTPVPKETDSETKRLIQDYLDKGGKITQFQSGLRSEEIDFKGGFYQRRKKKKEEKEGKNG
jgi:hypothetical protein|tara:strand:- start:290 stop:472 length:183 start_codon:yes stop_codon:yes gene_type:complete